MLSITPVLHAIIHWGDTCADRLPPHGKVCMGRALTTAVFQAPSPAHCALTRLIIYYLPPPAIWIYLPTPQHCIDRETEAPRATPQVSGRARVQTQAG